MRDVGAQNRVLAGGQGIQRRNRDRWGGSRRHAHSVRLADRPGSASLWRLQRGTAVDLQVTAVDSDSRYEVCLCQRQQIVAYVDLGRAGSDLPVDAYCIRDGARGAEREGGCLRLGILLELGLGGWG